MEQKEAIQKTDKENNGKIAGGTLRKTLGG